MELQHRRDDSDFRLSGIDETSRAISIEITDLTREGRYIKAIKLGEHRLDDFAGLPHDDAFLRFGVASAYLKLVGAARSGRSDEPSLEPIESLQRRALRHLQAGLKTNPSDRHCLQLLGRLYLDMGCYERSLESYRALHRIEPESPFALHGIYQSAKRVGNPVEADEACRKIAEIPLSSPQCLSAAGATLVMYERARLLLERCLYVQVIKVCQDLFTRLEGRKRGGWEEAQADQVMGLRATVVKAKALNGLSRFEDALGVLRAVSRKFSDVDVRVSSYQFLRDSVGRVECDALLALGRFQEAFEVADQLTRPGQCENIEPTSMYTEIFGNLRRRCSSALGIGRYSEAGEAAQQMVDISLNAPANSLAQRQRSGAYGLLARSLALQGDREQFIKVLGEFRRFDPNHPHIALLEIRAALLERRFDAAFDMAMAVFDSRPFTKAQLELLRLAASLADRNQMYREVLMDVRERGLVRFDDQSFEPFDTPPKVIGSFTQAEANDCIERVDER